MASLSCVVKALGIVTLLQGAWVVKAAPPVAADALVDPAGAAQVAAPPAELSASQRVAHASKLPGSITIDGALDEQAWQLVAKHGEFWQREPEDGTAPTHPTEFRVAYSDDALYVAVRAFDAEPQSIARNLTRRDVESASDWITIGIDSYYDRRTAFAFALNPHGVQRDYLIYDNESTDDGWDAVWAGAARIDRDGWTAEFRIPYSQLRFTSKPRSVWGLQIMRDVQRRGEVDVWSPWPKSDARIVSQFGELRGLDDIDSPGRLELAPYAVGGAAFRRDDPADPLDRGVEARWRLGGDFKLGIGSAFTLTGTINPDFGQVEADPSQVNLTASELFFAEKRPFFVEGTDVFVFELGTTDDSETLFYTRRIGAPPHGDGAESGIYVDQPSETTIYGAAKLSGKTSSGWSIGLLEAVTAEERARVVPAEGQMATDVETEPLTSYTVARVRKDLRQGRTSLGAIATAVHRQDTEATSWLHDRAYTGGLEATHRFAEDRYVLSGKLMASSVHGTPEALLETQTSSVHWYQRSDATHLDFDPTRTQLRGYAASLSVLKELGALRGGLGLDARSPGLETNDLGFQLSSDIGGGWLWLQYRNDRPGSLISVWDMNLDVWHNRNFARDALDVGAAISGNIELRSTASATLFVSAEQQRNDPGGLRGGPMLRRDEIFRVRGNVSTNQGRAVAAKLVGSASWAPSSSSQTLSLSSALSWRPASNFELALGPSLFVGTDDNQYVTTAAVDDSSRYVVARIRQVTNAMTVRANYTVSPTLSLQLYAQPFVVTGRYRDYKEVDAPQAANYDERYHLLRGGEITTAQDTVAVDRDENGVADYQFARPDFALGELRSNVVVRWEYRPGSSFFVIWSHGRASGGRDGRYALGRDLSALADETGEHVVLAKLSFWHGL